jgi:ketopantoate reductase
VVRLAGANGVDVPHTETLYALYRLIDHKQHLNSKT